MTTAEFRCRLSAASTAEQTRLLAKLLRQARDTDVWHFTTPIEIRDRWPAVAPLLGRRRPFSQQVAEPRKWRGSQKALKRPGPGSAA